MTIATLFWIIIAFLVIFFATLKILKLEVGFKYERFLLLLVLFISLGLVMDFVHEFGHAIWGIAVGGRLTYMQIAYFEIYPRLGLASYFMLGSVIVEDFTTEFARGLFLLGGSMTTNIVSWLLAILLLKTKLEFKTQLGLRIMGLLGLLDLPFYVVFPQIGLRHWIFLGGCQPEPLTGARTMGIPDSVFYTLVLLTTLGLGFLYFKPLWIKAWQKIITTLKRQT